VAIYHLSAKVTVAAAAYRSAGRLRDERQGIEHDFSRKRDVVHTEIIAPENAPDWMRDRDQLWNAVELVERRKDAQLAREIEVSLPRELDRDARLELVRGFVDREFVERGMIADVAVHEGRARDGLEQPHAHIMLTMRELTGNAGGRLGRAMPIARSSVLVRVSGLIIEPWRSSVLMRCGRWSARVLAGRMICLWNTRSGRLS